MAPEPDEILPGGAEEPEEPADPGAAAPAESAEPQPLEEFLDEYVRLSGVPEEKRDDEYGKAERACRERINTEYWRRLLARLAEVVGASTPDELVFSPGDERLFDFGWVDARLFPPEKLASEAEFRDPLYPVRGLRQHLAAADADFLLVPQRRKLAEDVAGLRRSIETLGREITATTAARNAAEAKLPATERSRLTELDRFIDGSTVALATLEVTKRSKGLPGEQMRDYARLLTAFNDNQEKRRTIIHRLGERAKPVDAHNNRLHQLRLASVQYLQKMEGASAALNALETAAVERRARRRAEIENRLAEIREDVVLCGRWGRTTASPALLQDRELNTGPGVVEAIRRVEDFDPGLFANRKVEREGRPAVVITPGIGNGSYDFRSNVLIVPRTSPRSRLEAVAFALALYRRDVDKSLDEGNLWKSFTEDIAWAKLGGRPRSVQAQMRSFVRAYTVWATREAAGQPVLQPELRDWFEGHIAPSTRGPIMVRELRGIPASRRDELLAKLQPTKETGRPGAEEMHRQGCLHWLKGDFAKALDCFDRARKLDESFPPAWWGLAACYRLPPEEFKIDIGLPERMRRASEALGRFITGADQSWWTRRAQALAAETEAKLEEMRRAGS